MAGKKPESNTCDTCDIQDVLGFRNVRAYDIDPLNEDKRIRVYGSQVLEAMIKNSKNLKDFWFNLQQYEKTSEKLIEKFPHRKEEIQEHNRRFLAQMKSVYRSLKEKEEKSRQNRKLKIE